MDADKKIAYVDESIFLTYDMYTRLDTRYEGFEQQPRLKGYWIEEIPIGKKVEQETIEVNQKKFIKASIRKLIVFPMSLRSYVIEPGTLRASYKFENSRSNKTVLLPNPVELTINDFPWEGKPVSFTGSSGEYQIESTLSRQAENLVFKVIVQGRGNIRQVKIPDIDFSPNFQAENLEEHVDLKFNGSSIEGTKTFYFNLHPTHTGNLVIPAVVFSYFNPEKNAYETVRSKELNVQIDSIPTALPVQKTKFQKGLIVLLDVSGTMLAEDMGRKKSRLSVAKTLALKLIQESNQDWICLKTFRIDTLQSVCSSNKDEVLNQASNIRETDFQDGTALGNTIFEAIKNLNQNVELSKTIVLLTDGTTNTGYIDPLTAFELARENGVVIHSLALGKGGRVPFPIKDPKTGKRQLVQAEVNVDEEVLSEISQVTGGKLLRIKNLNEVNEIIKDGSRLRNV